VGFGIFGNGLYAQWSNDFYLTIRWIKKNFMLQGKNKYNIGN
jgi:hypothetical protein